MINNRFICRHIFINCCWSILFCLILSCSFVICCCIWRWITICYVVGCISFTYIIILILHFALTLRPITWSSSISLISRRVVDLSIIEDDGFVLRIWFSLNYSCVAISFILNSSRILFHICAILIQVSSIILYASYILIDICLIIQTCIILLNFINFIRFILCCFISFIFTFCWILCLI